MKQSPSIQTAEENTDMSQTACAAYAEGPALPDISIISLRKKPAVRCASWRIRTDLPLPRWICKPEASKVSSTQENDFCANINYCTTL